MIFVVPGMLDVRISDLAISRDPFSLEDSELMRRALHVSSLRLFLCLRCAPADWIYWGKPHHSSLIPVSLL